MENIANSGHDAMVELTTGYKEFDSVLLAILKSEGLAVALYVKQCIDPWHTDTPVGAPNRTGEPCLPFLDKVTLDIALPGGFAGPGWSFQIQICDSMYPANYTLTQGRDQNYWAQPAAAGALAYGGVLVLARNGGGANMQWSDGTTQLISQIGVPTTRWNCSKMRINAVSVKIEDTTPVLNAGGMCHAADHNEPDLYEASDYTVAIVGALTVVGNVSLVTEMSYPAATNQLINFPGYLNHQFPHGVLANAIIDPENEPAPVDYTHRIFESAVSYPDPSTSQAVVPVVRVATANANCLVPAFRAHKSGVMPKQINCTNLQLAATCTLTVKIFSECYYSSNVGTQSSFLPLVRKACPWSPKANGIISRLQRDSPTMTPANRNSFGTWLRDVVRDALPDIADILGFIPHPLAQAGALAARTVLQSGVLAKPMKKKKIAQPVLRSNQTGRGVVFGPIGRAEAKIYEDMVREGTKPRKIMESRSDHIKDQRSARKREKKRVRALNKGVRQ